MSTSQVKLVSTLVQLGDTTSRNLEFSYRPDVPVRYGEETITESNLLELRRRHWDVVHIRTFSRHCESKIGSDWEWYIVGRRRTLKMRVQAKRVQRNAVLKITHKVTRSGRQQRDLLIQTAKADGMRPMYCIYCTASQQSLWRRPGRPQSGCLLADAGNVHLHTRSLRSIEWACWPWHFLFEASTPPIDTDRHLEQRGGDASTRDEFLPRHPLEWNAPTILDLNEDTGREYDGTGVENTTPLDLARVNAEGAEDIHGIAEHYEERQVDEGGQRMVAIDVRSLNPENIIPS